MYIDGNGLFQIKKNMENKKINWLLECLLSLYECICILFVFVLKKSSAEHSLATSMQYHDKSTNHSLTIL